VRLERNSCETSTVTETQPVRRGREHVDSERTESPEGQQQAADRSSCGGTRESSPRSRQNAEDSDLTNPMVESSKFMSSSSGRTCKHSRVKLTTELTRRIVYLGTSSNWSFHGQILNLVYQHIRKSPLPSADLLFDGSAYDLPWDGSRSLPDSNTPIIPSIDYVIFLINAVKFHYAQLVYLFDEEEFMSNLHAFYSNTDNAG
jgi:proline utilization trans-activator